MPTFAYEATTAQGGRFRGTIDAPTRSAAVERILASGQTPLKLAEHDGTVDVISASRWVPQFGIGGDRLAMLRDLSRLLRAGLSVERALVAVQGLTSRKRVKAAASRLIEGLRAGEALSSAMSRAEALFPETMCKLVAAGEASGRLPDVMMRLAEAHARNKALTDRAVSALIYPALLVVVMIAVLVTIFTVVLPRLEPLFAQSADALPWPAAVLLAVSHFFNFFGWWLAAALVLGVAFAVYAIRRPETRLAFDRWAATSRFTLDLPRRYQAAQFCRNLAMLIDGGMPLNRALEAAEAALSNRHIRAHVAKLIEDVRQGRTLKSALGASAIFPRLTVEFAAVGEETGKLGMMLNEAADVLDHDVQTQLDRMSALLLPAITIVLGVVVAAIMGGMVSGILAANDLAL